MSLGFTQLPHALEDLITAKTNTKGQEKVLRRILRLTLGQQQIECLTDIRTLSRDTHCGKNTVSRALKALEESGIIRYVVKSRTIGVASLIQVPILEERQFLPLQQKKKREERAASKKLENPPLGVSPEYGADGKVSGSARIKFQPQSHQKEYQSMEPLAQNMLNVPTLETFSRVGTYKDNSLIDTMYYNPDPGLAPLEIKFKSKFKSKSVKIHQLTQNEHARRLARHDVVIGLIKKRYSHFRNGGKSERASLERNFFAELYRSEQHNDLELAYLTLIEFEKNGTDFNGKTIDETSEYSSIGLLIKFWKRIRVSNKISASLLEKAEQMRGFTLAEYEQRLKQKQKQREMVSQDILLTNAQPWEKAEIEFLSQFPTKEEQEAIIARFAAPWRNGRIRRLSAAKAWWDSECEKLKVRSEASSGINLQ